MRFKELLEMPSYKDTELPISDVKIEIISGDSLDRDYNILGQIKQGNRLIVGAINRRLTNAIIGPLVKRDDGKTSMEIVVNLSFHPADEVMNVPDSSKVIQADTVVATPETKGFGYGYNLYKMLMNDGWTVLSDNIQFKGGRELWMKIVRRSALDNHNVYILTRNGYLKDENGQPIRYNGSNIPDDMIWGKPSDEERYYTLLVAKNN